MNLEDLWLWDFAAEVTPTSLIVCPAEDCGQASPVSEWSEAIVGCEDCGTHAALVCPRCDERFDHVGGPTFEVREPEAGRS